MKAILPSIFATLLWAFGIFIICVAIYGIVNWHEWIENLNHTFLVFVTFSGGLNAIATGALIDMHHAYKTGRLLKIENQSDVGVCIRVPD